MALEQPAMDRLQAVAHVRPRSALGDRREGVGEVAPRQRVVEGFVEDPAPSSGGGGTRSFMPDPHSCLGFNLTPGPLSSAGRAQAPVLRFSHPASGGGQGCGFVMTFN